MADLASTAKKHKAQLAGKGAPEELSTVQGLQHSLKTVEVHANGSVSSGEGGLGSSAAYVDSQLQLSTPGGIAALTPELAARASTAISATTTTTLPRKRTPSMPSGQVLAYSPMRRRTMPISPTKKGAYIRISGGNIEVHGPGTMAFMAFVKELTGPKSTAGPILRFPSSGVVCQLIQPSGKKYKHTMLHLELYSTSRSPKTDPLTISRAPYQRRSDLVDPTPTLDKCVDH